MAKPRTTSFTEEFEPILISAWNRYADRIDKKLLEKTRAAITNIRRVYRFKEKYPSSINFRQPKYRAGYLAAFGQRHAYLPYWHLKKIREYNRDYIPKPKSGNLTITSIGAGASIEIYGLCLFYNEERQDLRRLQLNLIEKIDEWGPTRNIVFGKLLNDKFPKINIKQNHINADITQNDCVKKFAEYHDALISTDIVLIYNVLNEIDTKYASSVYRNIQYILRQANDSILILLMEPNAKKAQPRVKWLLERFVESTEIVLSNNDEDIVFTEEPICITLEETSEGLNDRLFNQPGPHFENSLKRTHMACFVKPWSPIPYEKVQEQLEKYQIRRAKGKFVTTAKGIDNEQQNFLNTCNGIKISLTESQSEDEGSETLDSRFHGNDGKIPDIHPSQCCGERKPE
ncbi:MAG: hypothetical protein HZB61_09105 [Nitrospirae bacterium]|nr:hypothetical protein [Nitrospirota bacterium]